MRGFFIVLVDVLNPSQTHKNLRCNYYGWLSDKIVIKFLRKLCESHFTILWRVSFQQNFTNYVFAHRENTWIHVLLARINMFNYSRKNVTVLTTVEKIRNGVTLMIAQIALKSLCAPYRNFRFIQLQLIFSVYRGYDNSRTNTIIRAQSSIDVTFIFVHFTLVQKKLLQ